MSGTNKAYPIVEEYFDRMMLSKLGYRFNGEDLDYIMVQCFTVVANEVNKLDNEALNKKR